MSWSNYLKPISKTDEMVKLEHYIDEVAMSISGRMDIDNYNTFLRESVELLSNAIDVFCSGYYDAAYYLVRAAIEVSTVGVYFSDSRSEAKSDRKKSWTNLEYFPVQKKILKSLQEEGSAFTEFQEKIPALSELIKRRDVSANKMIHKQGYASFYCIRNHPVYCEKYSTEKLTEDFIDYIYDAIGIVAIMRLAIDPFPILLTDQECKNRFADSITRPFSEELVDECIGGEILDQYKTTTFYQGHKAWLMETFPVMSDAAYNAQEVGYIAIDCRDELLADIHLVSICSACAIIINLLFDEVCNVYIYGGIEWFFNNRFESRPSISSSDLFRRVVESGKDNFVYKSPRHSHVEQKEVITYLTARLIGDEDFVIETVSPFSKWQIEELDSTVEELGQFFKGIRNGQLSPGDIKLTSAFQKLIA